MLLAERLRKARPAVDAAWSAVAAPYPACTLFFSACDGVARAVVVHASGADVATAWRDGVRALRAALARRRWRGRWLRVDWITSACAVSADALHARLHQTKRNYWREGLAFDVALGTAITEQELNANAILSAGRGVAHAMLNLHNLQVYARTRFSRPDWTVPASGPWHRFRTAGVFVDEDGLQVLHADGLAAGRRVLDALTEVDLLGLVQRASSYLARQVNRQGRFRYGQFPCFDRAVEGYNTLRHASTTYAMIEAWGETRCPILGDAIRRSLAWLERECVRIVAHDADGPVAMLVDTGEEIKLGGNAVLILALTQYAQATGHADGLVLARALARGIRRMQDPASGAFVHVLHHPTLSVKAQHRIIYYDGEAAFALMRLFHATREPEWLAMVEKAFTHFIRAEHWRAHDHWLSYCVNELTRVRPDAAYLQFGVHNVAGHLDFVAERITTFPTLLELMMASRAMLERLSGDPAHAVLYRQVDIETFERALAQRAHRLLDGVFWPELAMFMRRPDHIVGSCFIRHHGFRVRIDDVEHYLSGFVAYLAHVRRGRPRLPRPAAGSQPVDCAHPAQVAPVPTLCAPSRESARLASARGTRESLAGPVIAVIGRAGRATTVAMIAETLSAFGPVGVARDEVHVAGGFASLPTDARHVVLGLALERMRESTRCLRPDVVIVTDIAAVYPGNPEDLQPEVDAQASIFNSMQPSGAAIINRDLAQGERIVAAARASGLRVVTYGADGSADVRLRSYRPATHQLTADVAGRAVALRLGSAGRDLAMKALAVLCTAHVLGLALPTVVAAVSAFVPPPGNGDTA